MIHGAIIIMCAVAAGVYLDKKYSARLTTLESRVQNILAILKIKAFATLQSDEMSSRNRLSLSGLESASIT